VTIRRYGLLLGAALLVLLGVAPPAGLASRSAASVGAGSTAAVDRHVAVDPAQLQLPARSGESAPHLAAPDALPGRAASSSNARADVVEGAGAGVPASLAVTAGRPRAPPAGDLR
jgi:hypothetical protein